MTILERHDSNGIATLHLNAPDRLNALSDAMLAALQAEIDSLRDDRETRVVILAGRGKAFCAGHDLREMTAGRQAEDGGQTYFADLFARCTEVMLGLQQIPQPVIAQVHGIATAAGCQLVASCDMAVAAEGTRFGVNGVNIGLFCSTPMVALTRNISRKHAFEMLTTGEFINAARAEELGLINRIAAAEDLEQTTKALAQTVAGKLDAAVKIGKRAFYDQLQLPTADAYAHTGAVMVENLMLRDTVEGIDAFLEKRDPDWKNR
ncbi:enoyl-CoA hydratase [Phaeobacter inhibens]|uniref:Enoyl-CoA hydratase domain-containing protein 3, mitochondrial n=1 Tax=Phaeobacter inhibens TaxID=221822 RepID=A0A2I7K8K2_9RHOB|nr:enoyl-CoA hydratase [Phaeobacter inhibens]AUQ62469.1 enoyl-CoA hydratase-like protein [Phaeobacter inhibens]AUQ82372.1 enoyl-CoA hydratase-like protein [Phaeobacter inhibens]AUQ90133.1 enoyl-CoA hydratase-like protein [Phaeobacter inhibens]AUQ98883.1 enoyl-CoA hydratase-like protein [Phaeobacter inhibens]MDO6755096.1 enoyl-CoA hydratase [Phaeobacter inhibens]